MIESRYTIEYIDPNPKKNPSKLGKFLIYSILTLSVLTAIVALIYSNLPTRTSQDISSKVQGFFSSASTTPATTNNKSLNNEALNEKKPILPATSVVISTDQKKKKDNLAQQQLITSQRENEFNDEIKRLSQENATQHDETVKQLKTNRSLSEKIKQLSKQLADEESKRSELTKEVMNLNKTNVSVSTQLKEKIKTVGRYANKLKKLENKQTISLEAVTPPASAIPPNTPKVVEIEQIEEKPTAEPISNKSLDITTEKLEEKPTLSPMDAIIAAMEAENKASSTKTIKTNSSSEEK